MNTHTYKETFSIAIIGTGFSGLCLAIQLKKAGYKNFTLFEKEASLGGTWRDNTYPGAECDVPSALYSFSFEPNPEWSRKWSEQEEILAYIQHCAHKYDIYRHIQFNEACKELNYQEAQQQWQVVTSSGTHYFNAVASGVGQLHKPFIPEIPGYETFLGESFHSARWQHDVDLTNKTVNVIGNAASAVQFIPQIAPKLKQLNVFQRSPNWIIKKNDRDHYAIEKWLGRIFPWATKLYRFYIWFGADFLLYQIMNKNGNSFIRKKARHDSLRFMRKHIKDEQKRNKLTPDYPIGAKRILFSDDYYPAMARENVNLISDGIEKIDAKGVQTTQNHYPCDILIFATGFETTRFLTPMQVKGKQGLHLNQLWEEQGAEAYLGITHAGFPNFFMMYGPNTNLGHNSIILMIEAQACYILSCLKLLENNKSLSLDVKAVRQKSYNASLQENMKDKIWSEVEHSWYKEKGKITNNWSGRTSEYRRLTRSAHADDFIFDE